MFCDFCVDVTQPSTWFRDKVKTLIDAAKKKALVEAGCEVGQICLNWLLN